MKVLKLPEGPLKVISVSSARLQVGRPAYLVDVDGQRYYARAVCGESPFEFLSRDHGPRRTAWFQTTGALELYALDSAGFIA